jgi:hypothetical protein
MFRVTVTVDGENWGVWDNKTGGKYTSDQGTPYRPGGLGPAIALGGTASTENVVLTRLVTLEDDWKRLHRLIAAVGRKKIVIKQAALDTDGNAFNANPLTHVGIVASVEAPEHDSNSTDPAILTLEATIDGLPVLLP